VVATARMGAALAELAATSANVQPEVIDAGSSPKWPTMPPSLHPIARVDDRRHHQPDEERAGGLGQQGRSGALGRSHSKCSRA
jgi:hypothetical protein